MATIRQMLRQAAADGYTDEYAEAKVCQDVVLKAISESSLSRNATIKGGVVMRSISHNVRRATQDMDIDFIRYSLSDESIRLFIQKLNCIEDIHISQTGMITELKQQEYHGKRVHIEISDKEGDSIQGKIDLVLAPEVVSHSASEINSQSKPIINDQCISAPLRVLIIYFLIMLPSRLPQWRVFPVFCLDNFHLSS